MSLLILFPRRAFRITLMAVSYGGGQGGNDYADDFEKAEVKKPQVVKKKLKKKKVVKPPSVTLEVEAIPATEKVEVFSGMKPIELPNYELEEDPDAVDWKYLLKPKQLKALEEVLDHLGKIRPKHIEKYLKRFKKTVPVKDSPPITLTKIFSPPKTIKVELPIAQPLPALPLPKPKPKPVTLDFSDEELLLAVHLIEKELKPKVKLDFTDEELLLAIYIMMENKK